MCDFCEMTAFVREDGFFLSLDKHGKTLDVEVLPTESRTTEMVCFSIEYCPMCGKKLAEEEIK